MKYCSRFLVFNLFTLLLALAFIPASIAGVVALDVATPFSATTEALPVRDCGGGAVDRGLRDMLEVSSYLTTKKIDCSRRVLEEVTLMKSTLEASGTELWQSNSSMNMSQQLRLSRSPCLAVLTDRFYSDLGDDFKQNPPGAGADILEKSARPSLAAEAGKGSFEKYPPGFVLAKALNLSKNHRSLAMALIAHCGHDDQNNQLETIVDFSAEKSRKVLTGYYKRQMAKKSMASEGEEELENIANGGRARLSVPCPKPSSPFYVAKALGENVDIPAELKQRIAKVQAPTMGAGALPGKAYHLNFGAIVGCRLAECGVEKNSIQSTLAFIAKQYRTQRLTGTSSRYLVALTLIEDHFDLNWRDEKSLNAKGKEISDWLNSKEGKKELAKMGAGELASNDRGDLSWDAWKTSIDSSVLFRGGIPGDSGMFQARVLSEGKDPYYDPKTVNKPQTSFCPGWSEERCNGARARYETWMADYEWSEAQQRVGGGFGAEFCQKDPANDFEIEEQACAALEKLN